MMPMFTVTDEMGNVKEFDMSHFGYLYVDVFGRGTVTIKASGEGIAIDVYPLHVADEPAGTLKVPMSMLVEVKQ